ncbi:MAG: type II secretion system protein GspC [Gammaproteobacteria bacterium]|nr:type II secretion system protein GspC [Gammaproteobacteria bacterium]
MSELRAFSFPALLATVAPRLVALGGDRRLPLLAMVLAIALLAQGLALLTWQLVPSPELDNTGLAVIRPAGAKAPTEKSPKRQQISQWHLFGKVQKVVPKPVAAMTEAPDTRLNLKLSGVLVSGDPRTARATIGDGKGKEDAYGVGESLPGNAVLREIYADRVILEYRGRLETLRLPKEAPASKFASGRPASSRGRARGAGSRAETSALLKQYRGALMTNPQSLMNLVRTSPVTDRVTGRLKGFKIYPGRDRKLLGKFGLKAGDVVTGVNGVALDNPIKGLEIMRDLSTANSVNLEVERNGVRQSFSFQLD